MDYKQLIARQLAQFSPQIALVKHWSELMLSRVIVYMPDSLIRLWENGQRPIRWAMASALVWSLGFIVFTLLFVLLSLGQGVSNLFETLNRMLFVLFLGAVNFALLGYCVAIRSKREPVGDIVARVTIAYLIGVGIPIIGLIIPFLVIFFWGMLSGVQRGTKLVTVGALQKYLQTTEENFLRQRDLTALEPKFQIAGVALPNYLESLGFFMVGSPGSGKTQAIKERSINNCRFWTILCRE